MLVKKETTINPLIFNILFILAAIFGVFALILAMAQLNGFPIPFASGIREAFIVLAIVGFVSCSFAMYASGELYGWLDPFHILATVIGVLLTILVVSVLFQIQLPFVSNDETAFLLLAGLILIKVIVVNSQRILDLTGILYN